jgi:myosin heavy subunit
LKSGDGELLKKLQIIEKAKDMPDPKVFDYLKGSNCFEVTGINDTELWRDVSDSFMKMGFSDQEVGSVFAILSAVLYLGNVQIDASTLTDSNPCKIPNVSRANYFLGISKIYLN